MEHSKWCTQIEDMRLAFLELILAKARAGDIPKDTDTGWPIVVMSLAAVIEGLVAVSHGPAEGLRWHDLFLKFIEGGK